MTMNISSIPLSDQKILEETIFDQFINYHTYRIYHGKDKASIFLENFFSTVKKALKEGFHPGSNIKISEGNQSSLSLLHIAASLGKVDMVTLLIDKGINQKARDYQGKTFIQVAKVRLLAAQKKGNDQDYKKAQEIIQKYSE